MYKPLPPRPKKTNIVRSRTGCKGCRERRTKCDEKKPTCGTCARLGRVCGSVKSKLEFRAVTTSSFTESQNQGIIPQKKPEEDSQQPSTEVQIANLTLIQSLQHSERDIFYSTYWEDRCLPALHPIFRSASHLVNDFPLLKDSILALSSCHLSRLHAERRFPAAIMTTSVYSPSLVHQTRSQLFYSSAIKRFIQLSQKEWDSNSMIILTVLIVFAYIESTMGNFEGFYCHVQGLTTFLDQVLTRTPDNNPFLKSLLTAWMQPQFLVWWARTYFSSVDVQQQQPALQLPRVLHGCFGTFAERRVAILNILCESHRLNFKMALQHWNSCTHANEYAFEESHTNREEFIEHHYGLLMEQRTKLEEWLFHLPPSEHPDTGDHPESCSKPLRFQSHDAALNYAYSALSRIMQCTGFLHLIGTGDPHILGQECSEEKSWFRLLLNIVHGVDMKMAVSRNTYTIGFSGLLLAASLRCQDPTLGSEIERWLQALEHMIPTEEGSFPVYQALSVVKAINQQREQGRDVFAVSQPVDDGGGTPKFSSYNSQMINSLLIHGKSRISGDLFTDCISIVR